MKANNVLQDITLESKRTYKKTLDNSLFSLVGEIKGSEVMRENK